MEIPFHGTYDQSMFIRGMRLTERQTRFAKVFRIFALTLAVIIIVVTLLAWFTNGIDSSYIPRLVRNLLSAGVLGYFYLQGYLSERRLVKSLFTTTPQRSMQGSVDHSGIAIGPEGHRQLLKWEQFLSKGSEDQLYALMTTDGSLAVFHRSYFASEQDWQHFKQMAEQRVVEPKA